MPPLGRFGVVALAVVNRRQRTVALAALVVVVLAVAGLVLWPRTEQVTPQIALVDINVIEPVGLAELAPQARTVEPYRGLGAWVDGFDYSPPYQNGGVAPVGPNDVATMADFGVQTLYIQSGRLDPRSPDVLEDRWLLYEFLLRAEQHDIDVIAWYLPMWTEDDTDLDHLLAASEFEVLGRRFDGVAVDIEWNQDGLEIDERNRRFVTLSRRLREATAGDTLGAIVLPPVQTEVINPTFWPEFPWQAIEPLYDVWLPMSYWSFRTEPYGDGYLYNLESVQRPVSYTHLTLPTKA